LTGLPGGLGVLLAAGFRLHVEWINIAAADPMLPTHIDDILLLSERVGEVCALVLDMVEPDPGTADGLRLWIAWFDSLKCVRDIIADYPVT
jgi:hypothetical protein